MQGDSLSNIAEMMEMISFDEIPAYILFKWVEATNYK